MAGTVAFNKAFMLPKTKENKPEVRRCLELAWTKNANVIHGDWQLDYLAAIMYKGVFDEQSKAEMMLEHAIALIEQESRERTRYGGKAGVTLDDGLRNCRNALHQLRGEPIEEEKMPEEKQATVSSNSGTTKTITLPGGATMEMIYVAPGSFMMGSPSSEDERFDSEVQHRVTLTKGFWLGKYEVTQAQWRSVMGSNPSYFKGDNLPVENVSWDDCQMFIARVNNQLNCGARLPTEAEWEYACRAGTTTAYFWGNALNGDKANCHGNYPCGTMVKGPYRETTVQVGSYPANAWGFCDMHGNVWEWCNDWHGQYPTGSVTDPLGSASGGYRVLRGGSWFDNARYCRSAFRLRNLPGFRSRCNGFRLCCSVGPRE